MSTLPSNISLDKILYNLDCLQIKRRPLQHHAIHTLNEPDKLLYATVLVTLLANQDISEAQSRLLTMLLDSMAIKADAQSIYANIPNLNIDQLQKFCELCEKYKLGTSFLMDVLTLCRLDKLLSESQSKSLTELASLLGLDQTMLFSVLHLSNKVLGAEITAGEELSKLQINFNYDRLKPWHEFAYQVMTLEDLEKGINGGDWIILEKYNLHKDLAIKNTKIVFSKDGSINLDKGNTHNSLSIANANLINANICCENIKEAGIEQSALLNCKLIFSKAKSIEFHKSYFLNINNEVSSYTLIFESVKNIVFQNCEFDLVSSNGIIFKSRNADVGINNCIFNMKIQGGIRNNYNALYFYNNAQYNIDECNFSTESGLQSFIKDESYLGRGIIEKSIFSCQNHSLEETSIKKNSNIYIDSKYNSDDYIYVKDCEFLNASFYLNFESSTVRSSIFCSTFDSHNPSYRAVFHDSKFSETTVYYNHSEEEEALFSNCKIKNDKAAVIKKYED